MIKHNTGKVSIQLPLGGHSFSESDLKAVLDAVASSTSLSVVLPTHKTILVPEPLFCDVDAERMLMEAGLSPADDECVVFGRLNGDVVAVMAVSKQCHDMLVRCLNNGFEYVSPFVDIIECRASVSMIFVEGLLYISICDDKLLFAECVEVQNEADLRYVLECVNRVYNIYNKRARVSGDCGHLIDVCKRVFKNIVCE